MRKARLIGSLLMGVLVLSVSICWALQDPQKLELDRSKFMKAKVEHSKMIVEGLATENFDMIAQNSQDLMLLINESMWNAIQTPEYVAMSSEFKLAAERLRESAHDKNIDSATLAYFDVTLNCVRCHKYVRKWAKK